MYMYKYGQVLTTVYKVEYDELQKYDLFVSVCRKR